MEHWAIFVALEKTDCNVIVAMITPQFSEFSEFRFLNVESNF